MTKKEEMSAFVDNELSEFEERRVLKELSQSDELRGVWERHHIIRAALRKDLDVMASPDVAKAVMEAIAQESTHERRAPKTLNAGKLVAGLAVAASVVTIALLSLQSTPGKTAIAQNSMQQAISAKKETAASLAPERVSTNAAPLNVYLVDRNEAGLVPQAHTVNQEELR